MIFRVVIIGRSAVGKTSIITRLSKNTFYNYVQSTIGAAFLSYVPKGYENKIKYEIWDTAGQERYRSLAPMYYKSAKVAIVVYDVTCEDSFKEAQSWILEVKNFNKNMIIILLGNKIDLVDEKVVDSNKVKKYCELNDILFFETSAKLNIGLKNIFKKLSDLLIKKYRDKKEDINIDKTLDLSENKYNCCY